IWGIPFRDTTAAGAPVAARAAGQLSLLPGNGTQPSEYVIQPCVKRPPLWVNSRLRRPGSAHTRFSFCVPLVFAKKGHCKNGLSCNTQDCQPSRSLGMKGCGKALSGNNHRRNDAEIPLILRIASPCSETSFVATICERRGVAQALNRSPALGRGAQSSRSE